MELKKKAQQSSIAAVIFLVVGVAITVMLLVMTGALSGQTYELVESDLDKIASTTYTAQSFKLDNVTAQSLGGSVIQLATLKIYNASGTQMGLNNLTVDVDAGTALLAYTGKPYANGSSWLANFTQGKVEVRNSIKGGIISSFEALETTGDYLPLIVLAFIIVLILGLIVGLTAIAGGGMGRGGGGAL